MDNIIHIDGVIFNTDKFLYAIDAPSRPTKIVLESINGNVELHINNRTATEVYNILKSHKLNVPEPPHVSSGSSDVYDY